MKINIEENDYRLDIDKLIIMGKRINNEKRNFLFISKVLGKHIEVNPNICKIIGGVLASKIYGKIQKVSDVVKKINDDSILDDEDISFKSNEEVLVLGFAETATGLGMAVASSIENSKYMITTREKIECMQTVINFEEEHSHATAHRCFFYDISMFRNIKKIILVDDEITTGKSMLNIIKELKKVTKVKEYIVLSILDWRDEMYREIYSEFQSKEDINIEVLSLISGKIENDDFTVFYDDDKELIDTFGEYKFIDILEHNICSIQGVKEQYISDSGRFSTTFSKIKDLESKCEKIAFIIKEDINKNEKVLVVGHGENIYIPSRIASYIGNDVMFKSTTRSPIFVSNKENYPLKQRSFFFDKGVKYYFYNRDDIEKEFDKVIFIVETDLKVQLTPNTIIYRI